MANTESKPYDLAQIAEFNRRHDQYYGWTVYWPNLYTNLLRLPETFVGTPEQWWEARANMIAKSEQTDTTKP